MTKLRFEYMEDELIKDFDYLMDIKLDNETFKTIITGIELSIQKDSKTTITDSETNNSIIINSRDILSIYSYELGLKKLFK